MTDLALNAKSTAVLAMDFQNRIVDMVTDKDALVARTAALLDAARAAGALVVYVVVGFRPGFPEVSSRNKSFSGIKERGGFGAGDTSTEIHAAIAPKEDEVVVTKHRVGAFLGTDLEMVLRAHNIDTLVLTGISTSGVVLSTLRYAADSDYKLVVVQDCCADPDAEVHRVLTEKVYPRQADVVLAENVMAALA